MTLFYFSAKGINILHIMKKVWFIASLLLTINMYAQVNIIPQLAELKMLESGEELLPTRLKRSSIFWKDRA